MVSTNQCKAIKPAHRDTIWSALALFYMCIVHGQHKMTHNNTYQDVTVTCYGEVVTLISDVIIKLHKAVMETSLKSM